MMKVDEDVGLRSSLDRVRNRCRRDVKHIQIRINNLEKYTRTFKWLNVFSLQQV
jgi:hypothetical protein